MKIGITSIWITTFLLLSPALSTLSKAEELFKSEKHTFRVKIIAENLEHPWGIAFLPDNSILVTERGGQLRHVKDGDLSAPIPGLPEIAANGQGGLLDIAVSPTFSTTQWIYFSFTEPSKDDDVQGTALARARFIQKPKPHLEDLQIIFSQNKKTDTWRHFGSRIVFHPDGTLFLTIGDRGDSTRAQNPRDHAGSVLRLNPDGSIPADNPFINEKNAAPEIWSTGHRNPQGATLHPLSNELWTVEHGARGGDEINKPIKGKNYGWPAISYGRHYSGFKIGSGTHKAGMEQPIFYWDPSIAPSGLSFYSGDIFQNWQGNLFVGALKDQMLVRLEMDGENILHEERLLNNKFGRIRDVRQGRNGYLYLLTDESDGKILQIIPAE